MTHTYLVLVFIGTLLLLWARRPFYGRGLRRKLRLNYDAMIITEKRLSAKWGRYR